MVKTPTATSFQRLKLEGAEEGGTLLYPNPSGGLFNIQLPEGIENAGIVVYNIQGVLVKEQQINNRDIVDLGEMNNGIYLYRITHSGNVLHIGKLQILK